MRMARPLIIAAAGHPVQRGDVHRKAAILSRVWSVSMLVYIKIASQVNIAAWDGAKERRCRRCFSSNELAM
jgi:hypothetical protein